ncbi:NAD(P)H-dependent glycerol-3-phosphate dehydrogenase [Pseudobacteriovorax antillogorgiicola]|uniref:Glycerol-3-phosphate dehydrogenase [NAD(P)+] n=1 Tax=Pseudobacteriovorax antillogorgiicola TaxID=1513793 RepID=A0A1Y6B5Q2_9BACT|nr:NAD(P)H-dependent glycerol-3-phosphate dehydrogenase [Pseudobacteriovorax antillogorgiicola]TCS59350.1 glycerol 3-phosphate dehydrogenase (NAD(P)+) [Pseudobacteriovorax antillogorgiicola]SME89097.1 glycerol 3-phosphate dehydrogenase (NAD(P)+) [Pseudobacteriovorax antillogorgiicola]
MSNSQVLVLGAGNFGTALAHHLAKKGETTTLWARRQEIANAINQTHQNPFYLKSVTLSPDLKATATLSSDLVNNSEVIVIAVPTQYMRQALEPIAQHISPNTRLVCASKGIEMGTLKMPIAIVEELVPQTSKENIAILSGPSFAIEVAQDAPTAVSIASHDEKTAEFIQTLFHTGAFRAYTSNDPIGLEVAGALKNVIALASGAARGMGLQNNAWAALLTRGLAEITRVGMAMGSNPITFNGLGGVGDLFLTCTSEKSRNYKVGFQIGQGKQLADVLDQLGSVAEGVTTAQSAFQLSQKLNVDAPITKVVYEVIYTKKPLQQAVADLLGRDKKAEVTYP